MKESADLVVQSALRALGTTPPPASFADGVVAAARAQPAPFGARELLLLGASLGMWALAVHVSIGWMIASMGSA
jgi:hypothetical protein